MTHNGGTKIFEKVETPETVVERRIPVDRNYYIESLRVPMGNIFLPIVRQRLSATRALAEATVPTSSTKQADAQTLCAASDDGGDGVTRKKPRPKRDNVAAAAMQRNKEIEERAAEEVNRLILRVIARKQLQEDPAKKRACIQASPIARAFARQAAAAPSPL